MDFFHMESGNWVVDLDAVYIFGQQRFSERILLQNSEDKLIINVSALS